jgi:predicted esterase
VTQGGKGGAGIREVPLEVLRTARIAVLGPKEDPPGPLREFWYVLHGYRQLARRMLRRFRTVASADRLVVAPEGLSRFYLDAPGRPHGTRDAIGASWMTREDREAEIRDYVRYLDRVAVVLEDRHPGSGDGPPERTVLGFSQGAHTAARWAVMGRVPPTRLVLWGAGFPGDLPPGAAETLQDVEILLVRGDGDGLRQTREEEREEAWLGDAGLPYSVLTHPGGHEIEPGVLARLSGTGA